MAVEIQATESGVLPVLQVIHPIFLNAVQVIKLLIHYVKTHVLPNLV